jgi:hypothetical protein
MLKFLDDFVQQYSYYIMGTFETFGQIWSESNEHMKYPKSLLKQYNQCFPILEEL